ncbi:MAG: hypothetical protein ACYDCO_18625 [Armatimonadota bacterium]
MAKKRLTEEQWITTYTRNKPISWDVFEKLVYGLPQSMKDHKWEAEDMLAAFVDLESLFRLSKSKAPAGAVDALKLRIQRIAYASLNPGVKPFFDNTVGMKPRPAHEPTGRQGDVDRSFYSGLLQSGYDADQRFGGSIGQSIARLAIDRYRAPQSKALERVLKENEGKSLAEQAANWGRHPAEHAERTGQRAQGNVIRDLHGRVPSIGPATGAARAGLDAHEYAFLRELLHQFEATPAAKSGFISLTSGADLDNYIRYHPDWYRKARARASAVAWEETNKAVINSVGKTLSNRGAKAITDNW